MSEPFFEDLEEEAIRDRAYELSLNGSAGSPEENWERAQSELLAQRGVLHDTADLKLQHLEMTLTRLASDGSVRWRLRLARGEVIEGSAEPGDGERLPPEIAALVTRAIGDDPIAPAPVLRLDAGLFRLRQLLADQRRAMLTHEAGVRIGLDPENLHQHRVAARRTRAFLRATRAYTDEGWRGALNDRLRELGTLTGPVRDLDVLIEHVQEQVETLPEEDRAGAESLLALLEAERDGLRTPLLEALDGERYRSLLELLDAPPQPAETVEAIPLDELAAREFRRLLKAIGRLGKDPADEAVHALRITVKRARYASELAGAGDAARDRFLDEARTLQTLLGEHQDAAVAEERLRELAARPLDPAATFVAGRLAERQAARRDRVTRKLPGAWRRLRKLSRQYK